MTAVIGVEPAERATNIACRAFCHKVLPIRQAGPDGLIPAICGGSSVAGGCLPLRAEAAQAHRLSPRARYPAPTSVSAAPLINLRFREGKCDEQFFELR
jgi:hypothetical protein